MRRDPRIINLYDEPLHPRRALVQDAVAPGLGTTLLSCAAITLATMAFFWGYDAIAHRDNAFVPVLAHSAVINQSQSPAPEVPVPDMTSPEIVRANADVPPSSLESYRAVTKGSSQSAVEPKIAEGPSRKKKKVQIVRRIPN